jgi:hypothetical protein
MRAFVIPVVGLAALTAGVLFSANTPAIGVASSSDSLLINDARASGNATIFSGSTLQSGTTAAQVRLKDGAQVSLQRDSRGKLFSDHIELLQGSARISGYSANANGLKVEADGASSASVSMHGRTVEVASLAGNIHVFNSSGIAVANLLPGRALNLTPQEAGAAAPSQLVGCVAKSGNNFFLTDETSNVTVQLRGGSVKANRRFQVNGTMVPGATASAPATQVVNVVGSKDLNKACNGAAVLTAGAAAGAAGAGAGATTAVVAGVAAAAAVGTGAAVSATTNAPAPSGAAGTTVTPCLSGCQGPGI